MPLCQLCHKDKKLIQAHIIPQAFYATNGGYRVFSADKEFPEKRPKGTYDSNILCAECDNKLGTFDDYAKKVLIDHQGVYSEVYSETGKEPITVYRLKDKTGYKKIAKFFISVIWRASISSHKDFQLKLGPYEERARDILLGNDCGFERYFSVSLCYFQNYKFPIHVIPRKPAKMNNGANAYAFTVANVKAVIKCDQRPTSSEWKMCTLSEVNDLLMIEGDFTHFHEFATIFQYAKKAQERNKNVK